MRSHLEYGESDILDISIPEFQVRFLLLLYNDFLSKILTYIKSTHWRDHYFTRLPVARQAKNFRDALPLASPRDFATIFTVIVIRRSALLATGGMITSSSNGKRFPFLPLSLFALEKYKFEQLTPWKYRSHYIDDLEIYVLVQREMRAVKGGEALALLQIIESDKNKQAALWKSIFEQDLPLSLSSSK